jgi:hypothetical protein
MGIGESRSDYEQLGAQLRAFIQKFDPKATGEQLTRAVEPALEIGDRIGEPIQEDVDALREAFRLFLQKKDSGSRERLMKAALRLEQETREI